MTAVADSHDGTMRYKDHAIKARVEGRSLDVGCGRMKLGDVGLDVNDYGEADVVVDEGEAYPFSDDEFDTVICSEVLEHLDDPGFVVGEMKRVVKPDGKLLFSIPNSGNPLFKLGLWKQETSLGPPHVNFWTEEEFEAFLRDHGIETVWTKRSWYKKKLYLPILATSLIFEGRL